MKNLDQFPEVPRPSDASNPRPPRRRLNLARAGVAIAGIALLGLGGFALSAYGQWSRPMPLAHKVVTVTSALPIPQGSRETVYAPGDSATSGDFSHVTLQTSTVYVGAPLEISAVADVPITLHPPASTTVLGPAGPTIEFGGSGATMIWRASVPSVATPSVAGTPGSITYASWYIEFSAPGRYQIPVTIGSTVKTATVTVLPLPSGGRVTAHMTPPTGLHTQLSIVNPNSIPLHVTLNGTPTTLAPGQTVTETPGASYTIAFTATTSSSLAVNTYQSHGRVTYGGTVTTSRRVSYRPAHPPFRLPAWFWAALVLSALLLVASVVLGLTGGRDGRGTRGKGPGTAGASGTGANAS